MEPTYVKYLPSTFSTSYPVHFVSPSREWECIELCFTAVVVAHAYRGLSRATLPPQVYCSPRQMNQVSPSLSGEIRGYHVAILAVIPWAVREYSNRHN